MANPHPTPFDAIARRKAVESLARMDHLAILDDGIVFAERAVATRRAELAEAERYLEHVKAAKRAALDGRFVLLPPPLSPSAEDLVAIRRNPSWRYYALSLLNRLRRPRAYVAPAVPETPSEEQEHA